MKVLVDSHVHIYKSYDLSLFLSSAFLNFRNAIPEAVESHKFLCLTQSSINSPSFEEIYTSLQEINKNYSVSLNDSGMMIAVTEVQNKDTICLLNGRQFVCAEGFEILALIYKGRNLDRLPAAEILQELKDQGAIAVLPWSLGKWLGRKGRQVSALIDAQQRSPLLLGDIAMRICTIQESYFRQASKLAVRIVAGSDPLQMNGEEKNVACFFSVYNVGSDFQPDTHHLRKLLTAQDGVIAGKRDSYLKAALRWIKTML